MAVREDPRLQDVGILVLDHGQRLERPPCPPHGSGRDDGDDDREFGSTRHDTSPWSPCTDGRGGATVVVSSHLLRYRIQVADNLATADAAAPGSLTDTERALVAEVRDVYRSRTKADCTACKYCLPCPAGVDIPGVLEADTTFEEHVCPVP